MSVDQKLLKSTKFPPEFNQKVDIQKVNVEVIKKWVAGRISEIIGSEDDIVIELCFGLLEGTRYPNIKDLQIQLTGFLEKDTPAFCKELWTLCLSAQSNPQGVPKELLEAKKLELIQEKIAAEQAADSVRQQREQERTRERDVDNIRQRERGDRSERGRGNRRDGGGRGYRSETGGRSGGRDFERRPRDDSRSPLPRRRGSDDYRAPPPRRDVDTYVPSQGRRGHDRRPRRSPSPGRKSRSPSRSRSPPPRRRQRSPTMSLSRSRSITPPTRRDKRLASPQARARETRRRSTSRASTNRLNKNAAQVRSRSRSPRRRRHPPRRSPSVPPLRSRSTTPKKQRRRISYSRSRSLSRPARSPSLDRHGRLSKPRRRSPTPDGFEPAHARADDRKGQHWDRRLRRDIELSRSRSPPSKRRRSTDRYDSGSKRRTNTSSPEPEKDDRGDIKATAEVGSD